MERFGFDMLCNLVLFWAIYKWIWVKKRTKRMSAQGITTTWRNDAIAYVLFVAMFCASVMSPWIVGTEGGMLSPMMAPFAMLVGIVFSFVISLRIPPIGFTKTERDPQTDNLFDNGSKLTH